MQTRRFILGAAAFAGLAGAGLSTTAFSQTAQSWPSRPVKLLVGGPAGSGTDIVARLVALRLEERLGQPVVVENRAGAGGQVAAEMAAKSAPDGLTLVLISSAHASQAVTLKSVPYQSVGSFAWISTLVTYPFVVAVRPDSPLQTIGDLIRVAKAEPGKISYSSAGVGSAFHLVGEWISAEAGIEMNHIPFQGGAAVFADVATGRVDVMINSSTFVLPQLNAGKLRALAVTSSSRYEALPNVPTLSETLPGVEVVSWLGLAAASATPPDIVKRLNAELRQVLAQPKLQQQLKEAGVHPESSSPEEFRALVQKQIDRYRGIVASRKIELQ